MGPDTKHTALFLHHHHHIPGHDHMPRLPVIYNVLRFLLLTVIHLCFIHSLTHSFTYSSFVSFLLHSLNGQSISVMVSVQGSTAGGAG